MIRQILDSKLRGAGDDLVFSMRAQDTIWVIN